MKERDEDSGRYSDHYPTEAFLDAIRGEDGMAGTGEVADSVSCAHDTAYKRLRKLEEDGVVESRMLGNTRIWTIAE